MAAKVPSPKTSPLKPTDYQLLADFRYLLRKFMAFSEVAARDAGLSPQHHQALLAVKGIGRDGTISIGELAERLSIRHHSAVGLVDRLALAGLLKRDPDPDDHRRIRLLLTGKAERLLENLTAAHREELRRLAPMLKAILKGIT